MAEVQPHLAAMGLRRNPFPPTPDASCYFFTGNLERDLAEVEHCILARKGIILITGEVGLGKSTFVRRLLDDMEGKAVIHALVHNTFLQGAELLHAINLDFGIAANGDMARDIASLNDFLLTQRMLGHTCLLVIDDAQNLTPESLELLRLLTNLETGQEKLIQILLTGQPELRDTLGRPELRQLASRIVKHVKLVGMSAAEVGKYFEFRINQAGAEGRIRLSAGALRNLHRTSGGNPRRMHLILDRCLYGLLAQRRSEIDSSLVKTAEKEVDMFSDRHATRQAKILSRTGFALAGLLLAAGLMGSLNAVYFGSPPPNEKNAIAIIPQATSVTPNVAPIRTETPSIHPEVVPAHPDATLSDCLKSLPTKVGKEIRLIPLTTKQEEFVRADNDTCLYREGDSLWAAWRSEWKLSDLYSQQSNQAVRTLQTLLSRQGLLDEKNIDGFFGPRTRQALSRFQSWNGSDKNGEPDDLTMFLIERVKIDPDTAQHNTDVKMEAGHG